MTTHDAVAALPYDDICRSENVALCLTQHGGHTAFMQVGGGAWNGTVMTIDDLLQGANPNDPGFIEKVIKEYGDVVFNKL